MARNNTTEPTGWVGWIYFAGIMMIVAGIFAMISGFTALLNNTYYLVRNDNLVAFDFTTWGWIHLILGLVVLMAGMSVMSGHLWGRIVAVFLAMLGIIVHFAFMAAFPLWSIVGIILNVLVIYALTVHGNEARE